MAQAQHEHLLALERTPKAQLAERIEAWGRANGRAYVLGGPRSWSKDELVAAVCRLERGEEP
jgi:hypothetical protein